MLKISFWFGSAFVSLLLTFLEKDYVQDITWVKIICAVVIAFSVWLVGKRNFGKTSVGTA